MGKFASDLDPMDDSSNDQTVTLMLPSEWGLDSTSKAGVRLYTPVTNFDNLPDRLEGIFIYHDLYATPSDGATIHFERAQKMYRVIMKDDVGDEFSAEVVPVVSANTE
jgi:hypothetical protein